MREKRNFAQRTRVLVSDEVRKKYFLIYEGADTERIYFEAVDQNRDAIGINPIIELVPILRSYSEDNWSNPKKIIDRMILNLQESNTGIISYETFLNWIMEYLQEEKMLPPGRTAAQTMWARLKVLVTEHLEKTMSEPVNDLEDTLNTIAEYLQEFNNLTNDLPKILSNRAITYDSDIDKICFVVDRDRGDFTERQYWDVVRKCKENGFGLYISNPCFEFWLLLHFDEVMNLDNEKLLANAKVTNARRYAEYELRQLLPRYSKSKYNTAELLSRIDTAIRNETMFCEDEDRIENEVGSRVGILIKEMRQ